ncbi:MAG: hypothetical protein KDF58_01680 [Alphaproteobacteria bacterium]|nr:hypothetical protein [Alphaproteobacteria bacterium]HPF46153.1 hypothetical protein [Emcibacteraceae bacterium]
MFGIFKKKKNQKSERIEPQLQKSAAEGALMQTIEEKKKDDPLIALKIGAMEVKDALLKFAEDENGVHIETVLGILGSLAGNYCLISGVATQQINEGKTGRISRVDASDGKTYFMGELINKPLFTDQYSVWGLAGGMAQQLGASNFPDINELVSHTAGTIGQNEFGVPRLEKKHSLKKKPTDLIKEFHPILIPVIMKFTKNPIEFPILIGLAIQQLMNDAKDIIDPEVAVKIVMECAVPMSKLETSGMLNIE